ncbi:ABC transporter substrate-binding protein [Sphaerospermopsis aphanizomenoides BCCUSP55]|uniref:ABC transporter substrate-binding protein n=1 Tax=Sphaerospermopsis aphanizomenoides TaxID=459663 RepID=UPI001908589D|nr:ABC transporter substrate-binding protein [Sphaerospermopsis aphanizomenoides]MBK1987237.1 ABC transporter substrate-binding protein [Sphaerospermopsis aphanizomenoides BCCUSP55]
MIRRDIFYSHTRERVKQWLGFLFCLTFCLSLILHGCYVIPNSQLQPLKIGITTWPGFDIVLYAQATNIFNRRGLDVELVRFENQQDSARAVMRGSLDAAFVALWDAVQVDPGDDKPVIVLVTNISSGSDGIVAQAPIKTVKDLKGKLVGAKLGTVNHLILLEALNQHKILPSDVQIEDIANETAAKLMVQKKLDAAVIWQPLLGETAKKAQGNIIYTTKEVDSLVIDTLLTSKRNIQSKKAELIQFLSAWLDVMYAVETRPTEVYATVAQQLNQLPESFASDYNGLKKGDIAMQKRMFQDQSRLQEALEQMNKLLQSDKRAGRLPRQDIEINKELINTAIKEWKA